MGSQCFRSPSLCSFSWQWPTDCVLHREAGTKGTAAWLVSGSQVSKKFGTRVWLLGQVLLPHFTVAVSRGKRSKPKNNCQLGLRSSVGCITAWKRSEVQPPGFWRLSCGVDATAPFDSRYSWCSSGPSSQVLTACELLGSPKDSSFRESRKVTSTCGTLFSSSVFPVLLAAPFRGLISYLSSQASSQKASDCCAILGLPFLMVPFPKPHHFLVNTEKLILQRRKLF